MESMDLPLFPLNTVLFPGMPIRLHIFEDRYKKMISHCLESKQPFGVVMIESGQEANGPLANPCEVGCTAQIARMQTLTEGRMNVEAMGEERFLVESLDRSHDYLQGSVKPFPLDRDEQTDLEGPARKLHAPVEEYVALVSNNRRSLKASDLENIGIERMLFMACDLLQVSPRKKQDLLETKYCEELIEKLDLLYKNQISLLNSIIAQKEADEGAGPISLN